jgi:Domain of unknown function (DUF4124)
LQGIHNKGDGSNIMMTSHVKRLLLITCCCLAWILQVQAGAVYTWVDPHGVTHFSESPPPDPGVQPAMVELRPMPPPPSDYDDYYSVIRQAERMERRRLENEKLEAERLLAEAQARRARMEAEAAMQTPDTYADDDSVYLPAYPYYPGYGPGYGGKPGHPGYRPDRPGHWPDQPGYWPGQPGRPQPGPGFEPAPRRVISAIPARP